MSNVIEIKGLSKEYRLGTISTGMLTKDISSAWARFRGKEDPNSLVTINSNSDAHKSPDRIWALKDINLEIKQGEILGIIGKNGAGKTTLLKYAMGLIDVFEDTKFGDDHISYTFRLSYRDKDKTLLESDITSTHSNIISNVEKCFNTKLRN